MFRRFSHCMPVTLCALLWASVAVATPTRIVALAPHIVEILYAVGAGPDVVGAVNFSDYPPAAKVLPRVGSYRDVSVEGVMRLEPTLVLAMDETVSGVRRLEDLGLRVEYSFPTTVEGVLQEILRVGRWVGREREAAELEARLRARLESIRARQPDEPVRGFYEIWPSPLYTAGGPSFISNALETIGVRNVFSGVAIDSPRVSPESVVRADPEAIIIPDESRDVAEREAAWRKLFSHRPEIVVLPAEHALLHRPGPRLIDGMEQLQSDLLRSMVGQER